jgi:hypothetical protein
MSFFLEIIFIIILILNRFTQLSLNNFIIMISKVFFKNISKKLLKNTFKGYQMSSSFSPI